MRPESRINPRKIRHSSDFVLRCFRTKSQEVDQSFPLPWRSNSSNKHHQRPYPAKPKRSISFWHHSSSWASLSCVNHGSLFISKKARVPPLSRCEPAQAGLMGRGESVARAHRLILPRNAAEINVIIVESVSESDLGAISEQWDIVLSGISLN